MYKFMVYILPMFFIVSDVCSSTWTKTFGGSEYDEGYAVELTADGGYVIAGYTASYGAGGSDVWLLKVDADGNLLWSKTVGGSKGDYGYSMCHTKDGGYTITGYTKSFAVNGKDVWLVKTDANGDTIWTKAFCASEDDRGYCVRQTMDSGYIITGITKPSDFSNVLLIKTDVNGDSIWGRTYLVSPGGVGYSVCQTPDSGYMITGLAVYDGSWHSCLWIMKTDKDGDSLWAKTFKEGKWSGGRCIQPTLDSNYVITGELDDHLCLMKMDETGDTLWIRRFRNRHYGLGYGLGYFVQQTQDSGYIITAGRRLIKTDNEGNLQWDNIFRGFDWGDYLRCVREAMVDGYIIVGSTRSYGEYGRPDLWLIRTDPGCGIKKTTSLASNTEIFSLYPNPAYSFVKIELPFIDIKDLSLVLYDLAGRKVKTFHTINSMHKGNSLSLNLMDLKTGTYFVTLKTNNYSATKKLVVIR